MNIHVRIKAKYQMTWDVSLNIWNWSSIEKRVWCAALLKTSESNLPVQWDCFSLSSVQISLCQELPWHSCQILTQIPGKFLKQVDLHWKHVEIFSVYTLFLGPPALSELFGWTFLVMRSQIFHKHFFIGSELSCLLNFHCVFACGFESLKKREQFPNQGPEVFLTPFAEWAVWHHSGTRGVPPAGVFHSVRFVSSGLG